MKYPKTKRSRQKDDYHGTIVKDPYRWLEDDNATEVKDWVEKQNRVTEEYLSSIPFRSKIEARYIELFDFTKMYSPMKIGDYYIYYKNEGLQNQAVIYRQKEINGKPEVFIDPNQLSEKGTIAITILSKSNDNRYLAYAQSEAGSDWQDIHIMEVATGEKLPDVIKWVKFSNAAWYKNGFFYSRFPPAEDGSEFSGKNIFHSVYYHQLGVSQENDILIFKDKDQPNSNHYCGVTEDEKHLIINAALGTDGFELLYLNLENPNANFVKLFEGYQHKNNVIRHANGKFLVHTDVNAPNYRLVEIDLANPSPENWVEIIPESNHLLQKVSKGGGKLFAEYLKNATSFISQYDQEGNFEKEITLPGLGTILGFSDKADVKELFYSFTSFVYPGTIFFV